MRRATKAVSGRTAAVPGQGRGVLLSPAALEEAKARELELRAQHHGLGRVLAPPQYRDSHDLNHRELQYFMNHGTRKNLGKIVAVLGFWRGKKRWRILLPRWRILRPAPCASPTSAKPLRRSLFTYPHTAHVGTLLSRSERSGKTFPQILSH